MSETRLPGHARPGPDFSVGYYWLRLEVGWRIGERSSAHGEVLWYVVGRAEPLAPDAILEVGSAIKPRGAFDAGAAAADNPPQQ